MVNAFGRNYEEIGSSDKGLILKNSGKVKILWGKSFIDLIDRNGNINSQAGNLLKTVLSKDSISDDGFYFVTNTGELVAKVNGNVSTITTTSEILYISFMEEQELTSDLKYTALKNIGFIYDNINEIQKYPNNGIIYNEGDLRLYIILNGQITNEYKTTFPNFIDSAITIDQKGNTDGSLIIKGDDSRNSILLNTLRIYNNNNSTAFDIKDNLTINIEGVGEKKEILKLTEDKLTVNRIESSYPAHYKIYPVGKTYYLEIDCAYIKEKLSYPYNLIPTRIYNKENVILNIESIDTDIINTTEWNNLGELLLDLYYFRLNFKYHNEYLLGDILRFYLDLKYNSERIVYPIECTVISTSLVEDSALITFIYDNVSFTPPSNEDPIEDEFEYDDGVLSLEELLLTNQNIEEEFSVTFKKITAESNLLCFLVESNGIKNQDLIIGTLKDFDNKYNNKNFGIVSKQNILYSAKFTTDKFIQENNGVTSLPQIGPEEFPYYDNLLTNVLQTKYSNTTISEENTENNITCVEALNIINSLENNTSTPQRYTILGYMYGNVRNSIDNILNFTITDSLGTDSPLVVWDFTYSGENLQTTYNNGNYLIQVTGNLYKGGSNISRIINPTVTLVKEYYSSYGEYDLNLEGYDNVLVPYKLFRDLKSDMDKLKWKLDHTEVVYRSILRDLISSITGN